MTKLPAERHRLILEILERKTASSVSELREILEVNSMTLWRDLRLLEEQGLIKRVRGGAMRADVKKEPRFDAKMESAQAAKVKIAAFAAENYVNDGDILALEGGTTVASVISKLRNRNLTVLTNGLPALTLMRTHSPSLTTYCSGGLLREESGTFVGKEAITFFSRRRVTTFFMSATGLDLMAGLTDPNPQEIEVKQAMARSAKRIILLLDTGKCGKQSLMEALPLRKLSSVITEKPLPREYSRLFESLGIPCEYPNPAR